MIQQSMALWIAQYGYPAIFFLLIAGIVGFPIPDQLLLIISGYLVHTNSLSLTPTLLVAVLGSICGITLSYLLGRVSGSIERLGLFSVIVAVIFFIRRTIRKGNPEAVNTTATATATSAILE